MPDNSAMCGRLVQAKAAELAAILFGLSAAPELGARYNVAPSLPLLTIRATREGNYEWSLPRWGLLPHWAKEAQIAYKMINAKAETVAAKPAYRSPLRYRRCVVPADGFYEWRAVGKTKQPYFILRDKDHPLLMAGLWDHWEGQSQIIESCTIITTEANNSVSKIHNRMPALLSLEAARRWLDPRTQDPRQLLPLLTPYSEALEIRKVSTRVNKPVNDDAALIEALHED
jgi:putative SOS response-associated peptidase YedK